MKKPLEALSAEIAVGARESALSQVQVKEVQEELQAHHPIPFKPIFLKSKGDKDQKTSLRGLEKTNFFTEEIDTLLLDKKCRIAIHAAKDLPDPLPEGLKVVAITHGVDPADVLVMRSGDSIDTISTVATSSERREEMVKQLRQDLHFIDLRGTIQQRLKKLETGSADGIVMAEAALIRLGLTDLNRIRLPGETAPLQGQLAVVARSDDNEMTALFACIDSRKTLYLGLEPPSQKNVIHYPIIKIVPRSFSFANLSKYTHIIFTSKSAVRLFCAHYSISTSKVIAVGQGTAACLRQHGIEADYVAAQECAEGIIDILKTLPLEDAYILWPHSALSRNILPDFFESHNIKFDSRILYDTIPHRPSPLPNLDLIREIVFTSPSTIDAFIEFFGKIPKNKVLTTIGPITQNHLKGETS